MISFNFWGFRRNRSKLQSMKNEFRKRYYHNPLSFLIDIFFLMTRIPRIIRNKFRGWVSPEFQERLMMAVTAVNGCRYCNYYHTWLALRMGFERAEIENLLGGEVRNPEPEELTALLYAQHWAEQNAKPDPELREKLYIQYGRDRARMIEIVLRMIRLGNLSGNSYDYLLFRLSGGRWGL